MTKHFLTPSAILLVLFAVPAVWAQRTPPPEAPDVGPMLTLDAPPQRLNKIGLNYRMGLNITVDFRRLGGLALSAPGPVTGNTIDRTYDNGYNRVDVTGNNHGGFIGTWNWAYSSPNSFQGDHLVLQSYSTPANAVSKNQEDGPQHGVELTYSRELYREQGWRAGVEAGLGYTRISISDNRALRNTAYRTNDTYFGPGVEAWPFPPGPATFQGPGATINAAPSSRTLTILPRTALISGNREIDADVFTLRLGPYLEVPLNEKFAVLFSGGLTLGFGHTDFSYRESVTISDPTFLNGPLQQARAGSGSQTDFLVGGYVGGSLSYALTEELSLVAGAQFQAAGEAVNNAKGKQAILNLGQSVIVSIGAAYSF